MTFNATTKSWTRRKRLSDTWSGIRSDRSRLTMASCVSHRLTTARFSSATVSTTESKLTIIASKTNATKLTSARATFKCTQIIIAKILRSTRRASSVTVRRRSVSCSIASSTGSAPLTSTAEDASTRSRTKRTWVSSKFAVVKRQSNQN